MPAVSAAGFTEIGVVDTPDGAALLMRATRRNAP